MSIWELVVSTGSRDRTPACTPMREENTIPRQSYTAAAWEDRA